MNVQGRCHCGAITYEAEVQPGTVNVSRQHPGAGAELRELRRAGVIVRDIVTDGPFAETKELVAGFWIGKRKSKAEAIEWAKRCPNPMPGTEAEIEIRQIFEVEDFGEEFTPELRAQEERLRAKLQK